MLKKTLKTAIYALILVCSASSFGASNDIICNGPNLSAVLYSYKGNTKLIFKKGNGLPISAVCRKIETGEHECREDLTGENLFFKFNESTREARIDIGQIRIYGLKCPLPQKKSSLPEAQPQNPGDSQI